MTEQERLQELEAGIASLGVRERRQFGQRIAKLQSRIKKQQPIFCKNSVR